MMLGQKIKTLLKEKGMKPTTLARKLNVSLPRISNYINSKREPDFEMLLKIAQALDVDLNYFAGEDNTEDQEPSQPVLNLSVVQVGKRKNGRPATLPIPKDFLSGIAEPASNVFVFEINSMDGYFDEGSRVVAAKCASTRLKDNSVVLYAGEKTCTYIYTIHEGGQYLVSLNKKGVSIERRIDTPEDLENCYVALWVIKKAG